MNVSVPQLAVIHGHVHACVHTQKCVPVKDSSQLAVVEFFSLYSDAPSHLRKYWSQLCFSFVRV